MNSKLPALILRLALGGLLAWAGAAKFGMGHSFAALIANYDLLPAAPCQILAITLPWVEFAAGLLLLLGLWTRPAAWVAAGLALVFMVAVATSLARGLDIPCGCFGGLWSAKVGWGTLALEIALLAAAVGLVAIASERKDSIAGSATPSDA